MGRVSVFVSVRRFGEDSTDRCLGDVRFFSENLVEWVRCSSCMILFGVFGVDLQCHG